jgi:hypothetical protein
VPPNKKGVIDSASGNERRDCPGANIGRGTQREDRDAFRTSSYLSTYPTPFLVLGKDCR